MPDRTDGQADFPMASLSPLPQEDLRSTPGTGLPPESGPLDSTSLEAVAPGYGENAYAGFGTHPNAPLTWGTQAETGAAAADPKAVPAPLADLLALEREEKPAADRARDRARTLRLRTLHDTACTLGVQQAVRWRYDQLVEACRQRSHELDRIFNFGQILLAGRVLPPILRWAGPVTTVHDGETASHVEETYRIVAQARIVSTPPTWRDYLLHSFAAFEAAPELLPRGAEERDVWQEGVRTGWDQGLAQAEDVFADNMARLVADYRGMLRFCLLAKWGMVSLPRLAEGHLGIRVGDRTLDVNQTILRISVPAAFRDRTQWTR